jgi:excisionase family DNA binding protein
MSIVIEKKLEEISNYISQQVISQKTTMNLSEAATYAGVSKSYLYKLTSTRQIAFYRPASKLIFFKRTELDAWILQTRLASKAELSSQLIINKKLV